MDRGCVDHMGGMERGWIDHIGGKERGYDYWMEIALCECYKIDVEIHCMFKCTCKQ